tara:strand:- start:956 stop:1807 length:852 start_codon:yes stop_codon:yes gene_type:complete
MFQFIFSYIKAFFKKLVFTIKTILFLDKLNNYEMNGNVEKLSNLKFLKRTQLKVSFSNGRSIRGYSFDKNISSDPIYKIILQISKGKSLKEIKNDFSKTLQIEKNSSAQDIVGLKNHEKLNKYPAWSYVLPWEKMDIDQKFNNYKKIQIIKREEKSIENNYKNNFSKLTDLYSEEMVESQVLQSKKLYEKIYKFGFIYKLGLPSFYILINEKKWRWYVSQGNHRSYTLHILKHRFMKGTIESIIDKKNANLWPNVKNGLYNIKDAEKIFDCFFEGKGAIGPCI